MVGKGKKMDWIDKIQVSCLNEDDEGKMNSGENARSQQQTDRAGHVTAGVEVQLRMKVIPETKNNTTR